MAGPLCSIITHGVINVSNQQFDLGTHSNSPAGQGCLWVVLLGVVAILASAYMSSYKGTPDVLCDRLEAGCRAMQGKPYKDAPYKGSDQ